MGVYVWVVCVCVLCGWSVCQRCEYVDDIHICKDSCFLSTHKLCSTCDIVTATMYIRKQTLAEHIRKESLDCNSLFILPSVLNILPSVLCVLVDTRAC